VTGTDTAGIGGLGIVGEPLQPPYTSVVSRGLTLAALAALGEGGEANAAILQSLLEEKTAAFCLNMSKLNLYQCLSVSKPHYEDVFCIGQHILLDTAQCVDKAAGAQAPVAVAAALPASISSLPPAPAPAPGTRAVARPAR
jgi:hypothetical protein